MALTVGTAGHVDHGKTTLVRALTGKDTDRLPEERARGISIDLGYAPLELPDGAMLSLVDVPGHERFVRTMVAGATGIDLFLLVVDAAEGARAQTHEHLAILRLLGVEQGVVAVTKSDVVDEETLELAVEELNELVPGAPVVAVSGITGQGLDELRAALAAVAADVEQRRADFPTRLFVDRVFTLAASGRWSPGRSGRARSATGDQLRLEPAGRDVRVRSVQVHDVAVERASAGQRVAASLPGVERERRPPRGRARRPGCLPALLPPRGVARGARADRRRGAARRPPRDEPDPGARRPGRRRPRATRLAAPVVAARGDRVVLRAETTVGGAVVLDPAPPRGRDADRDRLLDDGDPRSIVRALVHEPVRVDALAARALLGGDDLEEGLDAVRVADGWAFAEDWLEETAAAVEERLRARAGDAPLEPGLALAELLPAEPWAPVVLALLPVERRGGMAYLPGAAATLGARAEAAAALEQRLTASGLVATKAEDPELARYLEGERRIVRLGEGYVVSAGAYEVAQDLVRTECASVGEITLARFRDLSGVGRRDAQLLLERMDVDGVTRRVGDRRVLRRAARPL